MCREMLTKGVGFIRTIARPHTTNVTKKLLQGFGWDLFDHPAYSPDLTPSVLNLFLHLKSFLGEQRLNSNEDLVVCVNYTWLTTLAATFYEEGSPIFKLVPRYMTNAWKITGVMLKNSV